MNVSRIIAVVALVGLVNGLAVAAPFAWRWLSSTSASDVPGKVEVHIDDRLSHYSVRGKTAEAILDDMARKGPSRYWAYTHYYIEPSYGTVRLHDGRCAMSGVSVSFDVSIKMPELGLFHGASQCLADSFEAMYSNLLAHEMEHRRIGLVAAEEYAIELAGITPQPSCERLDREVVARLQPILHKTNRKQAIFDSDTNHGMKGGALDLKDC